MSSILETIGPRAGAAPLTVEITEEGTVDLQSAFAHYDGTSASGAWRPTLTIRAQNGTILARVFPADEMAAGDTADVTFAPFLGGDGRGAATVASTVAGLGSTFDGKLGLLLVSSSPPSYVPLVYSSTVGKWLGPYLHGATLGGGAGVTTASAAFVGADGLGVQRAFVGSHALFYNAGMRMQVDFMGFMFGDAAGRTASLRLTLREFDDGDTVALNLWTSATTLTVTGTTGRLKVAPWNAMSTAAPTKQNGQLVFEIAASAGIATFANCSSRWRWVSA